MNISVSSKLVESSSSDCVLTSTQPTKYRDLVYDVGLHKGEDTDYYLKKGFRVVAFEADPDLVKHCRQRFADDISNGRLTIIEGAIVDPSYETARAGWVRFYKNNGNSVWGTVLDDFADRYEHLGTTVEAIETPAIDFTACLEKYGIPYYLKVDIEGMDLVCIKALMHFEQRPDYLSIESEKASFDRLCEEFNLLEKLGYAQFQAVQQQGISRQREPGYSREGRYVGYTFQNGASGLFGEDLPAQWKNRNQVLEQYTAIFRQYRLFGDYGRLSQYFVGKLIRKALWVFMRKAVPGWYDTHAKHSTVDS